MDALKMTAMNARFSILIAMFSFVGVEASCQDQNTKFESLLRKYEDSINAADTVAASKLWSKSGEVSFINPRSTEYRWSGVKNIYKMFADNFTERRLHGSNVKTSVYGDFAWLTFEWVFDATLKFNSQKIQTKGRETQVWRKEEGEWHLVHVHYSGLPTSGQGQGF